MKPILYTNGDSVVWGAELENKQTQRFSNLLSVQKGWIDCNNASAGVSNDYIYRQTMRDVSHWLNTGKCWSEESGWIESDELKVVIGWTSPTRFEWWTGTEYQQERLWVGYDMWGDTDKDRVTELTFIINQTEDIPSYIRTFNHIIGLSSFLEKHKIQYVFFNAFYEYQNIGEPHTKIDKFGREQDQIVVESLWEQLPNEFKKQTMYEYIIGEGGDFLPRKHPTKESHQLWASYLNKKLYG
jgi:hypothetical protein